MHSFHLHKAIIILVLFEFISTMFTDFCSCCFFQSVKVHSSKKTKIFANGEKNIYMYILTFFVGMHAHIKLNCDDEAKGAAHCFIFLFISISNKKFHFFLLPSPPHCYGSGNKI